jgi:hypothetical protein
MKKILTLALLAACGTSPQVDSASPADPTMAPPAAPDVGNPTPAASSAPLDGMLSRTPASSGRPACAAYDGCDGSPGAVLIAAAWMPTATGARVEFPIELAAGAPVATVRGIMDCEPGAAASFQVEINDPYNGWQGTFGPVAAACDGVIRGIDVEVDSNYFVDAGLPGATTAPSMTAVFVADVVVEQAAHFRGVEVSGK